MPAQVTERVAELGDVVEGVKVNEGGWVFGIYYRDNEDGTITVQDRLYREHQCEVNPQVYADNTRSDTPYTQQWIKNVRSLLVDAKLISPDRAIYPRS